VLLRTRFNPETGYLPKFTERRTAYQFVRTNKFALIYEERGDVFRRLFVETLPKTNYVTKQAPAARIQRFVRQHSEITNPVCGVGSLVSRTNIPDIDRPAIYRR
jgi:hypothetical protein